MVKQKLSEWKQDAMYSVVAAGVVATPLLSDVCISWTGLCGVSGIA